MNNSDFSYFDQYQDIELDLTSLLTSLSSDNFTYSLTNMQPAKSTVKNLFTKYNFINDYKSNINVINIYTIQENEKPEDVSFKLYDTVEFWWILFVFNNIKNPMLEWPLNQSQLNDLVELTYQNNKKYTRDFYYEYFFEENEKKRKIITPKTFSLPDIIWAYREKIINENV